jgi:hypothetical protein
MDDKTGDRLRATFMTVVSVVVLLSFGLGIYLAGRYTLWVDPPRPNEMPPIMSYLVSTVNGVLAANLGALLGINISLSGWQKPQGPAEILQWSAAGWYLLMLLLAAVFWGLAGFSEDASRVVPLLPEMTKNGIGIFIAILAAVLGVQTAVTRARALAARGKPGSRS